MWAVVVCVCPYVCVAADIWHMHLAALFATQAVVQRATHYDAILYEEALAHFKARAERYGCPLA